MQTGEATCKTEAASAQGLVHRDFNLILFIVGNNQGIVLVLAFCVVF